MNRAKKSMPKHIKKKVTKTLKNDLKSAEDTQLQPVKRTLPTTNELLATQPKKKAKIEKNHLISMEKSVHRKKAKAKTKQSKRASPKDAIVGSEPAHVHKEGSRWIQTLKKQTKINNKITAKKTAKIK
jgi:hypothetical protein